MNGTRRIPIPWKQRWRRFRHGTLPVLGFVTCLAGTFWLWGRQGVMPNATGEVEAVRVMVTAAVEGTLKPLPARGYQWVLFDLVKPNDVIAQLDDAPLQAGLDTLKKELVKLQQDLDAAKAKLDIEEIDRHQSFVTDSVRVQSDTARLQYDLEQRRLTVLEHVVLVETDRLESERLKVKFECLKRAFDKKMIAEMELNDARMLYEEAAKRLAENGKLVDEAKALEAKAEERIKRFPKPLVEKEVSALIEAQLSPIRQAVSVQQARIHETEILIGRLAIRAPLGRDGSTTEQWRICAIHRLPGENVRAGDPIVTLAAEQGNYILSYVRQEQRLVPKPGMAVDVRARVPAARPVAAKVDRVGPQVEMVPLHQCRDPKVQEWGLPVRIILPAEFSARPGELLDVTFKQHSPGAG